MYKYLRGKSSPTVRGGGAAGASEKRACYVSGDLPGAPSRTR